MGQNLRNPRHRAHVNLKVNLKGFVWLGDKACYPAIQILQKIFEFSNHHKLSDLKIGNLTNFITEFVLVHEIQLKTTLCMYLQGV